MITTQWWIRLSAALALLSAAPPPALAQAQAAATTAGGPSFVCGPANTAVERTICASPALAAADRAMATLFALARPGAFGTGGSNQLAVQRDFIKAMRGCAAPSARETIASCLQRRYDQRNNDLALAALIDAPDQALPVLRRTDPAFAPLLEALALWVSEPSGADWSTPALRGKRQRISALLTPTLQALQTDESQAYGRDILADPGPGGVAVRTIADLFRSERHFAAFLNVVGPYLPDEGWTARPDTGRRNMPCAALVRHPALFAATAPVFGSTLDNFVLDTDCAETLPATPLLAALDRKLMAGWPPCEGTIRFAAYRTYGHAVESARLGQVPGGPSARPIRRRGVTAGDIAGARAELAAYYTAHLGKSDRDAASLAARALAAVLASAQECD